MIDRLVSRVRLFLRDYFSEFGIAWSLARMNDCERWGGHYWGPAEQDESFGWSRTCSGCGTLETISESQSVATGLTMTVWLPDATNGGQR